MVALALALATGFASAAAASPLEDPTLGGAVFTGTVHPHATSIYVNPAALGQAVRGSHVYLDTSLRLDRYHIDRQVITDPDAGLQPGPSVSSSPITPGGSLIWYNVGDKIAVAAALSLVVLDKSPGDQDALGYHTLGDRHRQYVWRRVFLLSRNWGPSTYLPFPMPTLGASYRWRRFYFGVGLSLRASSLELDFLRDTALEAGREGIESACDDDGNACGIENPAAAERYKISVSTEDLLAARNLVVSGGLMWQFRPGWWFGVYYQSPPGFLTSLSSVGTARITPAPRTGLDPFTARAEVIYDLPQTVSAGLRGPAFGSYEMFTTARWQNLSRQRLLDIRLIDPVVGGDSVPEWFQRYRGFNDVLTVEAGLEERERAEPGERLRLGARVRLETPTTSDRAVAPTQVESLHLGAAVGGELRISENPRLVLYASYGFTWYRPVDIGEGSAFDPRDRLECADSGFDLDACIPAAEGRAIPTAAAHYGRIRHALRAAIRYDFL
ncbi:hypothetical protein [Haliangium sp.]|uniref:hypothetical protein n=1 Tax=Haliangium sp. TaxID=2663208 RepID=UPI003D13CC5B